MAGNPNWPGGLVYVDLFAGPGVCQIRDSGRRLPGSPLIAAYARRQFRKILCCELDEKLADACRVRLSHSPARDASEVLSGDCDQLVDSIVSRIPKGSLTITFIDPEDLRPDFATVERLARTGAVDFLLLFATATDLVRNVDQYEADEESKLDRMLGPDSNWRSEWAAMSNRTGANVRALFPRIYETQLRSRLNYKGVRVKEIRGPKGPLYSLVYASKHERGLEFWDKIAKKELGGQQNLF
jgi:three-Cys-motif partner protein